MYGKLVLCFLRNGSRGVNDAEQQKPVEQEIIEWQTVPAVFVNRFIVQNFGDVVRISFAEQPIVPNGPSTPRTTVVMRFADAVELTRLLLRFFPQGGFPPGSLGGLGGLGGLGMPPGGSNPITG